MLYNFRNYQINIDSNDLFFINIILTVQINRANHVPIWRRNRVRVIRALLLNKKCPWTIQSAVNNQNHTRFIRIWLYSVVNTYLYIWEYRDIYKLYFSMGLVSHWFGCQQNVCNMCLDIFDTKHDNIIVGLDCYMPFPFECVRVYLWVCVGVLQNDESIPVYGFHSPNPCQLNHLLGKIEWHSQPPLLFQWNDCMMIDD